MRRDYRYFVYMLNSSSRCGLYTGVTNALVTRVIEHRQAENPKNFTAQYRAFRLVYYEEFADVHTSIEREKQIKGWTRAKKNALVASMNPQWRDLISEWERNTDWCSSWTEGLGRQTTGRAQIQQQHQEQPQHQPQGPSRQKRALRMTRHFRYCPLHL